MLLYVHRNRKAHIHAPIVLQVKYHPSLVWMEITSFIKGSFKALAMPEGCLDRKGYEEVGRKQAPNFTGDRQKVRIIVRWNSISETSSSH